MSRKRLYYIPILLAMMAGISLMACSEDEGPSEPSLALNNCTSCHLDAERLVATAEPEEGNGEEDAGEG